MVQAVQDMNQEHIIISIENNTVNVNSLKRQEMMTSSLAVNDYYGSFINNQIERSKSPMKDNRDYMPSDNFTAKQKKLKFLEGQDQRVMFSDSNLQTQNTTQDDVDAVNVHTLNLDKIPGNITADELKRNLQINHLVSMQVDTDNLKNVSTGKGQICFRSNRKNEKQIIMEKLKNLGISSKDYVLKNRNKTPRVATSTVGFLDSKNELDLMKGNATERRNINTTNINKNGTKPKIRKKVTGKVGENMYIKPKDYLHDFRNDTAEKRVVFYESNGDLFGNTNGTYSQNHSKKLAKNRSNFEKDQKDNRMQHKIAQDWTKMQKRLEKYATNRAIQPKINRYGKTYDF